MATINEPRFLFDAAGNRTNARLLEPAGANQVTGARCEGAVAGTPGTPPPGWQGIFPIGGLASQIIGAGTSADGIPYLDVRLFGTTTAAGGSLVRCSLPTAIAALTGQAWAGSAFIALVAGSLPASFAAGMQIVEWTSGGGFVTQASGNVASPTTAALSRQRPGLVVTLSGGATTAAVMLQLSFAVNIATALDVTLRIGLPQLEKSAVVTSPMLPLVGFPAVAPRAADVYRVATQAERRARLVQQLTAAQGQTRAFFIALAAGLGIAITITEFAEHTCEQGCETALCDLPWVFAWQVNAPLAASTSRDMTAEDTVETPLVAYGDSTLECLIRRLAPAHTTPLFAYS